MLASGRHRRPGGRPDPLSSRVTAPAPGFAAGPVPPHPSRGTANAGLAVITAVIAAVGAAAVLVMGQAGPPAMLTRAGPTEAPITPGAGSGAAALAIRQATGTVRASVLDIPSLGVRSALVDLGVDAAGALMPPATTDVAGWFTGGALPGEVGPAVIAGHIDSRSGPGVFYRLSDLRPGADVVVGRSDGLSVRYRVTEVQSVPKDSFPTERVYGPTPGPELHLITCGGEFDRRAGRYLRNVVVTAVLAEPS